MIGNLEYGSNLTGFTALERNLVQVIVKLSRNQYIRMVVDTRRMQKLIDATVIKHFVYVIVGAEQL